MSYDSVFIWNFAIATQSELKAKSSGRFKTLQIAQTFFTLHFNESFAFISNWKDF
jgi:hypothetical protein